MLSRRKRDFDDAVRLLKSYSKWEHAQTQALQLSYLNNVWQDSIHDIPYYRKLVESGAAPLSIATWNDFLNIPELTRQILQDHADQFHRRSGPPDLYRMTGGSTGNPIRFGVWHDEDRTLRLLKLTLWIRSGYRLGDRIFLIWGHSHLLGTGWKRHLKHTQRRVKDRLLGYRRVDAYVLNPENCKAYADQLLSFRPKGLIGYAAALDLFVRNNRHLQDAFRDLKLKFVMSCAEPPPKPDTFDLLQETFNCPVVQEFGGVDFGQVASQYGDEPFHVFPDKNIVELDETENGLQGESAVLVTSLYRRYLPLIRYRQGDAISSAEFDSQRHVLSFQKLVGRTNDMIRLQDGCELHSVALFHCLHQEQHILNIQMLLEDSGLSLTLVTRDGQLDPATENRIRHRLGQLNSLLAGIPIHSRTDIETTRAGKRRWFVDKRTLNGSEPVSSASAKGPD